MSAAAPVFQIPPIRVTAAAKGRLDAMATEESVTTSELVVIAVGLLLEASEEIGRAHV